MTTHTTTERAAALVAEAHRSGRYERAQTIVDRFGALEQTPIPRRALLVALSGQVERTPAIDLATRWAARRRGGIAVFSGGVGVGKTIAAAWYACRARAHWASAPALGLAPHARAASELDRLRSAHALVLDEVGGAGTTAPHAVDRIAALLIARHEDARPTVVTTNLDRAEFARLYDGAVDPSQSRLLDRVAEDGRWCEIPGPSRRSAPVQPGAARLEDARDLVRWVDHARDVSLGASAEPGVLERLQAALELDADRLAAHVEAGRASRQRIEGMVDGLVQKLRSHEQTREEIEQSDRVARDMLRRQVAERGR